MSTLFDIGGGQAVCFNPGGSFHGWLFRQHPDGQWVSVRQLEVAAPYPDDHPLAKLFLHSTPKCEHEFAGWREFDDGNGGEQVCTKCGMGAMAASLRDGP